MTETNVEYDIEQFKWVAAHEFGHILGVGDAYTSRKSKDVISIYNVFGTELQEIDIEKVLTAWETGRFQKWP